MDTYCRYCRELVADTMELSRVVQAMRPGTVRPPPLPPRRLPPPKEVYYEPTWSLGTARDWVVRIVCVAVFAVPVLFVGWCMLVAMMGAG